MYSDTCYTWTTRCLYVYLNNFCKTWCICMKNGLRIVWPHSFEKQKATASFFVQLNTDEFWLRKILINTKFSHVSAYHWYKRHTKHMSRISLLDSNQFRLEDFEDCRMLATLFKKSLRTDEQGHQRLGLDEFRQLVETDEFRSYLQTRGTFGLEVKT